MKEVYGISGVEKDQREKVKTKHKQNSKNCSMKLRPSGLFTHIFHSIYFIIFITKQNSQSVNYTNILCTFHQRFFSTTYRYVLHYCPIALLYVSTIDNAAWLHNGNAYRLRIKTLFHFFYTALGMGTSTRHMLESLPFSHPPRVHLRFPALSVSLSSPTLVLLYNNLFSLRLLSSLYFYASVPQDSALCWEPEA